MQADAELSREALEHWPVGAVADDRKHEPRIGDLSHRADKRVEPFLRREPSNRQHDEVVLAGAELVAERVAATCELVGPLPPRRDVDRVGEDPDAFGPSTASDERVARQ